ncbi:hypothetical protein ACF07Y_42650 [Streptomyces sp. NPDC016566]|uniref:hypothetical protein n=1 Tax=Streptomyces sp. NPDC016566 TaxID=3364967 RepID=UPI0036FE3DC2
MERELCAAPVQVLAEFPGMAWIGGDWVIDALAGEQTESVTDTIIDVVSARLAAGCPGKGLQVGHCLLKIGGESGIGLVGFLQGEQHPLPGPGGGRLAPACRFLRQLVQRGVVCEFPAHHVVQAVHCGVQRPVDILVRPPSHVLSLPDGSRE